LERECYKFNADNWLELEGAKLKGPYLAVTARYENGFHISVNVEFHFGADKPAIVPKSNYLDERISFNSQPRHSR
jgi:hypothetical protein